MRQEPVTIHDESGFEGMRHAGRLAAEVLDFITNDNNGGGGLGWHEKPQGLEQ